MWMNDLAENGATGLVDVRRLLLESPEMLKDLDAHLTSSCSDIDRPIPTIGGVRLRRLASDPALRAQVAAALPPPTEEWAQIGAMAIWQRVEDYSSYDTNMIVGYVPTMSSYMGALFADGHATLIDEHETNEFLERDTASRKRLGMPPLPAEWFALPTRK